MALNAAVSQPDHSGFPRAPALLRILCLHDSHSNGVELKESLALLGERLYEQHGIDLVFVDSPLFVAEDSGLKKKPHQRRSKAAARVWWYGDSTSHDNEDDLPPPAEAHPPQQQQQQQDLRLFDDDDDEEDVDLYAHHNNETPPTPTAMIGLDASLLLLQQIWKTAPFWGILGIGQGAALASLFTLLPTTKPPPALAIFANGTALLSERELLIAESITASLHLTRPELSQDDDALYQQFGGQRVPLQSPAPAPAPTSTAGTATGTQQPLCLSKADFNVIGRFLVEQKQELCRGDGRGSEIVSLQAALFLAELLAADTLAQQIAENPPAALMAVIRPNKDVMAGWSSNGPKRRQPGEEGGGAPCPSEFLLKRDKRPHAQAGGASREHPSQQVS